MRIQIVGRGRVGSALAAALPEAVLCGRGATGAGAELVLLAVPDSQIAAAAALIEPGPLVGHLSGATGLGVLTGATPDAAARDAFSLHPLLAVTGAETSFAGGYAAIDGTTEDALAVALELAERLGMTGFRVAEDDRATYHAAASVAANFLVTVEDFAERLAQTAGVPREALGPLAEAALSGWKRAGAAGLTGPIARGDEATISKQRAAVAGRTPADLALFDALTDATRTMAARSGTTQEFEGTTKETGA